MSFSREASVRRAVAYGKERVVFGRPIGANQAISHPLALAHMQLQAAWHMTRYAAWRFDHEMECGEAAKCISDTSSEVIRTLIDARCTNRRAEH